MKLNKVRKLFIKLFPREFLKYFARKQGTDPDKLDFAEKLFRDCQRIDIQPLHGENRGFILFLDNNLSLWFFQSGDSFYFDGYEVGKYDNGEVNVFDDLKR